MTVIACATITAMGAFGWSFWQNATLLRTAEADTRRYADTARNEISRSVIDNTETATINIHLQDLRTIRGGFADQSEPDMWQELGLSQHAEVKLAARQSYSDGLERMLRPRMILHLENEIPQMIADERTAEIYRALKVYLLLGGQGAGRGDDPAIKAYFEEVWLFEMPGQALLDDREQLNAHLAAMLELDDDRQPIISIDPEIVRQAREAIVTLPLAEQAYASIKDRAITSAPTDFNLARRIDRVTIVCNAADLDNMKVID
jgi:type VI secretion system protein ImpL